MNDDTKKIIWKKATKRRNSSGGIPVEENTSPVTGNSSALSIDDALDLAQRSADQNQNKLEAKSDSSSSDIDALRAEIQKSLNTQGTTSHSEPTSNIDLGDRVDNNSNIGLATEQGDTSDIPEVMQSQTLTDPTSDSSSKESSFNIAEEIDKMLAKTNISSGKESASITEAEFSQVNLDQKIEKNNPQSEINSLKESIHKDLQKHEAVAARGVEQTYYADVSGAMGSDQPATMAELLQKARFEEKEKSILSPRSKKNLLFIIGSILLLALTIFILIRAFGSRDTVSYITEKRVDSLVYSNLDTGIDITDIGSSKVKQAIRKVTETKLEEGSINQIYYVAEDENKNLRRLNIKQVFEATEHTPPQLLYENIESDFMHGVYKTDENQPFVILKTLSYDKVFEGMKEWEPTMIDDLATYLDLPDEATNRSLIQDGFSDDIIKNKNVRVARFVPRDSDRSFLQDLKDKITGFIGTLTENAFAQTGYTVYGVITDINNNPLPDATLFAKDLAIGAQAGNNGQYSIDLPMAGIHQIEYRAPNHTSRTFDFQDETEWNVQLTPVFTGGSTGNTDTNIQTTEIQTNQDFVCFQSVKICMDSQGNSVSSNQAGAPGISCYDELKNGPNDPSYGSEKQNQSGYACFTVANTGGAVGTGDAINVLRTDDVCFHSVTGNRLNTTDPSKSDYFDPNNPLAVCFRSFECRRFACVDRNNLEVPLSEQGKPGITCGESLDLVDPNFEGQKVCREYSNLRSINNINNSKLCFDENGVFTSSFTIGGANDNPGDDVNCITPTNRDRRLCLNQQNQVVVPEFGQPDTMFRICFDPLEGASEGFTGDTVIGSTGDQFVTLNDQIRQMAASLGHRFNLLAALGNTFGLNAQSVQTLKDVSDFFYSIAYMDVLQNETIEQGLVFVKRLEQILDTVDPDGTLAAPGPDGDLNFFGKLQFAIDFIKDIFGFSHNVAWSTLGNDLPKGTIIYAGQSVAGVDAIQSTLVLVGLMDPVSVNGTVDLVTQEAITAFQLINGLDPTGIIDLETLDVINGMVSGYAQLYGNSEEALVNDYFDPGNPIGLGEYSQNVQSLQIILYSEGYDIDAINGVFDEQTCEALMLYQEFNDLIVADPNGCILSTETIQTLNNLIDENSYLGSGYVIGGNGYLEGVGSLSGKNGPGAINFAVEAEAASLNEGDIILMYTFLDEETILITRHEAVITEIIKRRALADIFE